MKSMIKMLKTCTNDMNISVKKSIANNEILIYLYLVYKQPEVTGGGSLLDKVKVKVRF